VRTIVITVDQLRRPHPGGIGTYTRGLLRGLGELHHEGKCDDSLLALAPAGPTPLDLEGVKALTVSTGVALTTRLWRHVALGVPRDAAVVHATSLAGPFNGGHAGAVHSVSVQDLLWRDHPEMTTPAGARFHESRLTHVRRRASSRVVVTSHALRERLVADGFAEERLHVVRLGIDEPGSSERTSELLARLGVKAQPFGYTVAVGTIQPRKNVTRLAAAHAAASRRCDALGPLLLAGARGWGDVDTGSGIVLGELSNRDLADLVAGAAVSAYVPVAEGWGLPPLEALAAGRPVVSSPVPSVAGLTEVTVVDPLEIDAIADGLVAAATAGDDESDRARRRAAVSSFTWRNCALDHLAAWQ
jgi:glycosyltransferase involved in cell wall biosynthesis